MGKRAAGLKVYECVNGAGCSLGARGEPGRFTAGATADQVHLLTGQPLEQLVEGEHFGEGFCPCGKPGVATKETHVSLVGSDPHQHHHDAIAARVADESDPLTTADAQAALEELIP